MSLVSDRLTQRGSSRAMTEPIGDYCEPEWALSASSSVYWLLFSCFLFRGGFRVRKYFGVVGSHVGSKVRADFFPAPAGSINGIGGLIAG